MTLVNMALVGLLFWRTRNIHKPKKDLYTPVWAPQEPLVQGPAAHHIFEQIITDIEHNALCTGTCWIYRNGGIAAGSVLTDFFGPRGPGTAVYAKVKIGDSYRHDLYVGVETKKNPAPIKGSLPLCPVNWARMTLSQVSRDSSRCVYDAVLEITPEEAARHGGLLDRLT